MNNFLTQYIKPELLILVPVLYAAGVLLKKSRMQDFRIPYLLGLIGIALSIASVVAHSTIFTMQAVLMQVFTGVTQGILAAGASVYTDQLVKQGLEAQACKRCEQLKKQRACNHEDTCSGDHHGDHV